MSFTMVLTTCDDILKTGTWMHRCNKAKYSSGANRRACGFAFKVAFSSWKTGIDKTVNEDRGEIDTVELVAVSEGASAWLVVERELLVEIRERLACLECLLVGDVVARLT